MESITTVILALSLAGTLHFCLWWVRAQGLGLIAGFGFLCFVPTALYALDSLSRPIPLPTSPIWTQLVIFAFFVAPVVLGLYQSRWFQGQWTPWLWAKGVFSVYAELVLAVFLGALAMTYLGATSAAATLQSLFLVVYVLALLLLSCFGPCLGRFVRLAVPLVREAW